MYRPTALLKPGRMSDDDQVSGWQLQQKIGQRVVRLRALIRAGILEPPQSKAAQRREIELLTIGHPIRRIAPGVCTSLYSWSSRSDDVSGT
jgi:hypothetical protein